MRRLRCVGIPQILEHCLMVDVAEAGSVPMRVTVVRPCELGPHESEMWTKFQRVSPETLSPFMSLTFAQAVARARQNARVAIAEDGGEITAFLPFESASDKVALPIGHPMNDFHGFISSGAPIDARSVVKAAGLRGWRFDHAPASQGVLAPYCYDGGQVQASLIDLTDGFNQYLGSRSRSFVAKLGRQRRAVERQFGPVSLTWRSPDLSHLDRLIQWKSQKYSRTRQMFSDDKTAQIIKELAMTDKDDYAGLVSVLHAGGRTVAVNLAMLSPRGLTGWFAAYDPEVARFSPGTMMFFAIAEEAAAQAINRFDLGYGQDSYKSRLANRYYPVVSGVVWASRMERYARLTYRRLWHDRRYGRVAFAVRDRNDSS